MAKDPATRARDERAALENLQQAALPREVAPGEEQLTGPGALLDATREAPPPRRAARPAPLPAAAAPEPAPHEAFLACKHFASLDGLRAFAILAVVWHHTAGGPGRFGANLFFLLSGFLVTTILVRERARKGTIDILAFRSKRARRLYPLYFTVLAGYVALVALLEPAGPARADFFTHLPAFASFTSNLFVDLASERTIFYFAWSLAAQEQFYLLWPWLLKRARARGLAAALAVLLAVVYLARAGMLETWLPAASFAHTLATSVMPALVLGALLALGLNERRVYDALHRALGAPWAAAALLCTTLFLWRTPGVPEPCLHATLTLLTAACVVREDHLLAQILRLSFVVHIGTVSYGIYLLHMLCHNAGERALTRLGLHAGWLDFALTALLALGVATLSHRHFENRFLPPEKRAKRTPTGLRSR